MALLDGLEITLLKFSDLVAGIRIDAEMYQKHYLRVDELLKREDYDTLRDISDSVRKGIFDINAECYTDKGVPFVRITNLRNMLVDADSIVHIPESEHLANAKTILSFHDVVLSKTAYPAASLITFNECNISQDTVAVALKESSRIKSPYLVAFLNSTIGLTQMRRWFTGNIQMHLNLPDCKEIMIPFKSSGFQKSIENVFGAGIASLEQGKTLYTEANDLFLDELRLKDWRPPTRNSAIKSFKESFYETGRLDAEYYQPKFDELKAIISRNADSILRVESIATFNQRGDQPDYVEDGELSIINSRHILEQHLDYGNFERTDAGKWDEFPLARVFKNDILIYTTGANVGRANIYLSDARALASNHVNILRVENANPVYVAFVLNSMVGRMQTKQIVTGSAQAELYPGAIEQFLVPFVSDEAEKKIVKAVEESFVLKEESKRLLETAKRAVEIAIEQNEDAAMAHISASAK